jgi:hypothetical protein
MWGNWNSICFVAGKIDNTMREYAPDKCVFLTTFGKNILDVFFMNSGVPGVGFVYKTWKESVRNSQSGVPSQLHVQCNENGERMSTNERERAELEERLKMLVDAQRKPSQTQAILKIGAQSARTSAILKFGISRSRHMLLSAILKIGISRAQSAILKITLKT